MNSNTINQALSYLDKLDPEQISALIAQAGPALAKIGPALAKIGPAAVSGGGAGGAEILASLGGAGAVASLAGGGGGGGASLGGASLGGASLGGASLGGASLGGGGAVAPTANQISTLLTVAKIATMGAKGVVGIIIAIIGLFMTTLAISSSSIYSSNCAPGSPECLDCEKNKDSEDVQTMKTSQIGLGVISVLLIIIGLTLYYMTFDFSEPIKIGLAVALFVLFMGCTILSILLFNVTKNINCNCMRKAFKNVSLVLLISSSVFTVIPMGYGIFKLVMMAKK
jgi:uncharacterized protein YjbI with pentapeptide repeats